MKVLEQSRNFTAVEIYNMTSSPDSVSVKDTIGTEIAPDGWCLFEDMDKDGKPKEMLAIKDENGRVYVSNSPTFKREFFLIRDLFDQYEENLPTIITVAGTSKGGKDFVSCKVGTSRGTKNG